MNWFEVIKGYKPANAQEESDQEIFMQYAAIFGDLLTRQNKLIHLTGSGFIVNPARDKVLMVHHNVYKAWSWTGGHADGEEDLLAVAIREAKEETGVRKIKPVQPEIFSLDLLPVVGHSKGGKYVSAHLHLSVCFLLEAEVDEPLAVKPDENSGVKWLAMDEVIGCCSERHMRPVYAKLIDKIKA